MAEREQKREYERNGYTDVLAWTYYMLGADAKQLSTWHGIEGAHCGEGASVWMWPVERNGYGPGNTRIIIRQDGSREYVVADHLGSTRAVLNSDKERLELIDYEPFGKTLTHDGTGARTSYIGREVDTESDLSMHGVRQYSQDYGRFVSVDALWGRYRAWQPYQYAGNSPVNFLDFNGLEVDLSNVMLDTEDGGKHALGIVTELRTITGLGSLSMNDDNKLVFDPDEVADGGSEQAREFLMGLINDTDVLMVNASGNGSKSVNNDVALDFNEIQGFSEGVQGGLNAMTMGSGMTFLHEALHTNVGGGLTDDNSDYGKIGQVETFMNGIRDQLGADYGQRLSYQAVRTDDGFSLIPFSRITVDPISRGNVPLGGMYIRSK